MKNITIRLSDKYNIDAVILSVGDDVCVIVSGGDAPHIGAVSAGVFDCGVGAAPMHMQDVSNKNEKPLVTQLYPGQTATLVLPSHKEGVVSEMLAKELSARLEKNVTVLCGIHVDNLSKEGIAEIVEIMKKSGERIAMCISGTVK